MYARYTFDKGGYNWEHVKNLMFDIGGAIVLNLAEELVETSKPIEVLLEKSLAHAGFGLTKAPHKNHFTSLSGLKLADQVVVDIFHNSPLMNSVHIGDLIIELNGRVPEIDFDQYLISEIKLKRNRRTISLKPDLKNPLDGLGFEIRTDPNATIEQLKFRDNWLGS